MANKQALADLGRANMNEDALVEVGINTLRDRIADTLKKAGLSEATGFEVKLTNGQEFTILSPSNPRLDSIPAREVAGVTPRSSASAGSQVVKTAKAWGRK